MKGKNAQKNFGAVGAMAPTPLSPKTAGGGVAFKDPPPPGREPQRLQGTLEPRRPPVLSDLFAR